jgi:penicillin-binding protein 1A
MAPFLPSALGATEEPLLAMVSAYSTFPNSGYRVEPFRIRKVVDRDGNVIDSASPTRYKVLSDYVAAQMVDMMRGVVLQGTARAATSIGHELAGKTGTVNDFTDAWFIGYTPSVATGVWIGYSDAKKPLGKSESGATAALPFWIDFMTKYLNGKPKEKFGRVPELPDDLRLVQQQRSRWHAAELARIAARDGDVLPFGAEELPNLDPLAGGDSSGAEKTAPVFNRPVQGPPQQSQPEVRESPRVESSSAPNPKILRPPAPEPVLQRPKPQEEAVRKGKKGKVEDPTIR